MTKPITRQSTPFDMYVPRFSRALEPSSSSSVVIWDPRVKKCQKSEKCRKSEKYEKYKQYINNHFQPKFYAELEYSG